MMEDWGMYTNREVEELQADNEITDIVEGCLLDNLLFYSKELQQYVLCKEQYLNEWSSCLHVYVGNEAEIFDMWDKLTENMLAS